MWVCPNGHDCVYQHRLPEGYVFKKEEVEEKKDIKKDEIINKIDD